MCEEYNGWTNRETWAVALHLDNEENTHNIVNEYVKHALKECESPVMCLEESLENFIDELWDDGTQLTRDRALMFRDIGSIYRVNWREIATGLIREAEANA